MSQNLLYITIRDWVGVLTNHQLFDIQLRMESKSNQSSQGHWGQVDDDDDEQNTTSHIPPSRSRGFSLTCVRSKSQERNPKILEAGAWTGLRNQWRKRKKKY